VDTTLDSDRKHFDFVGFFIDFSLYRIVHEAVCGAAFSKSGPKKTKAANFGRSAHPLIYLNRTGKNYTVFSRRSRSRTTRD
jgi:hypothetical protein